MPMTVRPVWFDAQRGGDSYFARLCAASGMLKSSGVWSSGCVGYRTLSSARLKSKVGVVRLQGYPSWSKGPDLSSGA